MAEIHTSGQVVAHYVRGRRLLAIERPQTGDHRYYHADALGSIRLLSDSAATATDRYSYQAFGDLLEHQGTDPNPYGFAGEPFDPEAGLYYNRARWLDTSVGRFTSADPFPGRLRDPQSLHRYLYAHLDPVNRVDPSGRFTTGIAGALASFSVSGSLAGAIPGATPAQLPIKFRTVTAGEKRLVESVFLGEVDTTKVRIFRKRYLGVQRETDIMAPNGNIYYHPEATGDAAYSSDLSKETISRQALFIHEMTHVWQIQHGVNLKLRRFFNPRYTYLPFKPGKKFRRYGVEKQADIVMDYFLLRNGVPMDRPPICDYEDLIPWLPACPQLTP